MTHVPIVLRLLRWAEKEGEVPALGGGGKQQALTSSVAFIVAHATKNAAPSSPDISPGLK